MSKLRAAECRGFIQAATAKAEEIGVGVSIAVVGPEGHLIALERMDDAGFRPKAVGRPPAAATPAGPSIPSRRAAASLASGAGPSTHACHAPALLLSRNDV